MQIPVELKQIKLPDKDSHKGQNGRLLIIGGSHLFHAASLWALKVASRIVDLVHYASVEENNLIVHELKKEFRDGIVVPRSEVETYIEEDDCILIGPGMVRSETVSTTTYDLRPTNLRDIEKIEDEGLQTAALTNYLLKKYSKKQWVIDAGALQMVEVGLIPKNAILTPHSREFELLRSKVQVKSEKLKDEVQIFAKHFNCIVLLKGKEDIVNNGKKTKIIKGGNEGMTKGGTGDVLAGLVAALACKSDPWVATVSGSYINKHAGDSLYKQVGPFFNASDLADQIPKTIKHLLF